MNYYLIPSAIQQELLLPNSAQPVHQITSGLSGAKVWRCDCLHGPAALRCWPKEHPSYQRLQAMHRALHQARESQLEFVPRLYRNRAGHSISPDGGHLWELTEWCPGIADYHLKPSNPRLRSAMQALAQLHQVWGNLGTTEAVSPTVTDRIQRLQTWCQRLPSLVSQPVTDADLRILATDTLQHLAVRGPKQLSALNSIALQPVCLQFVLRDIWSDHVLFTNDRVTGVIDYGAARVDEPATDVARLLGSLEPIDPQRWSLGLDYYLEINPSVDRERVQILDRASRLLSALQWLQWLVLERRAFDTPPCKLRERWQGLLTSLAAVHEA